MSPKKGRNRKRQQRKHSFGSLAQYRIVVDELQSSDPSPLERQAYEKLLAIHFELPFQVPWPPNPHTTVFKDNFITFRFTPERRAIESHFGYPTTYTVTTVTAAVPANRFLDVDQHTMSNFFDWMLENLNHFILAYALVTKDGEVSPITLPMLGPFAEWGYIEPYKRRAAVQGLFLINPGNVPYEKPVPPQHITAEIIRFRFWWASLGYPFQTSWQLRIECFNSLTTGRYHVAAILLAAAFESRLNELLHYFVWKEGKTEDEFNNLMRTSPFAKRVRTEFHPRIGGNFDYRKRGVIQRWYRSTHALRNRVVHGGYRPRFEEISSSADAMVKAWDYVMRLVRKRAKNFPELAPYLELRGDQFLWPPRQTEEKQSAG